jgi:4-carboxymuconolactone decarboxylase
MTGGGAETARIELVTADGELSTVARAVAERIVETRGAVTRPFQVLLHAPALAERVAELGQLVRAGTSLTDADRELATITTGVAAGCGFVWTSHVDAAVTAGVPERTIVAVREGRLPEDRREATLVAFARELCASGTVSVRSFASAHQLLGTERLVELATTVGYYTMLARVMGAFEACSETR